MEKVTNNNFFKVSDGARIYYEDYNREDKDPIIILHGYLCSSHFFRSNVEELSKDHRLILIDWRGHGNSSKTIDNLTMERAAQDVKELLDYLNISDANLLGWSMGSTVVLLYYQKYGKHRLKSIGIIDSALYPFSEEDFNSHSLRGFNMDKLAANLEAAYTDYDTYCRNFCKVIFKKLPNQEDEDWVTNEMKKIPPWIAFALYTDFLHIDATKILKTVELPLLISGADSPAIPSGVKMAKHYQKLVDNKCFFHVFESNGHVMFYENPEEFNRVILDFVDNYCIDR